MSEVEAAVVRRRLLAMRELLAHLDTLGEPTGGDLRADLALRLQVSMAIAQLVTLATEINAHVVRQVTGVAPADLRSGFRGMADAGWIGPGVAADLRDSPGLRNVLVHEYVEVDLDVLAAAIPLSRRAFAEYVRQVAGRLPAF